EQLQIERAFILGNAANSLAIAQPRGYSAVRRGGYATPAAACLRIGRGRGIPHRKLDLRGRPIASDVRKIRAEDGAASMHHVATRALSFSEEPFTRHTVARRDDRAPRRLLQTHDISGDRAGFLNGNLEGGHSSVRNTLEDQTADGFLRCSARPLDVHDVGTVSATLAVFTVAVD